MSLFYRLCSLLGSARSVQTTLKSAQTYYQAFTTTLRNAETAAFIVTLDKARRGEPAAQCDLGEDYYEGTSVPQDYGEAFKWFQLAAAQGHARAQCHLGMMYFVGRGVPRDQVEGCKWLQLSAAQGNKAAANGRGIAGKKLPPEQLAEAMRRVGAFVPQKSAPLTAETRING